MVHHAAQQRAVEARRRKRQALDVAGDELDLWMLAAPDRDELAGNVEPDAVKAGAREQRGERARAAAEVDHARAGLKLGQLDERVDEARARLRREHVVVVRGGVAVEERDLLLLVLRGSGHALVRRLPLNVL